MNIKRKYYKSMSDIIFINCDMVRNRATSKIKNFALQGFFSYLKFQIRLVIAKSDFANSSDSPRRSTAIDTSGKILYNSK